MKATFTRTPHGDADRAPRACTECPDDACHAGMQTRVARPVQLRHATAVGGFCALLVLAYLLVEFQLGLAWFVPVAGTYVIVFGQPDSRMAWPRNLLGGHAVAFACGAVLHVLVADVQIAIVVATCLAFALMCAGDCVHSPAGSTPAAVCLAGAPLAHSAAALAVGLALALVAQACLRRAHRRATPTETGGVSSP